jgi:hypothetical protein
MTTLKTPKWTRQILAYFNEEKLVGLNSKLHFDKYKRQYWMNDFVSIIVEIL